MSLLLREQYLPVLMAGESILIYKFIFEITGSCILKRNIGSEIIR